MNSKQEYLKRKKVITDNRDEKIRYEQSPERYRWPESGTIISDIRRDAMTQVRELRVEFGQPLWEVKSDGY